MRFSKKEYKESYVWIWLPEETNPIIAGKLTQTDNRILFHYGKSYLERKNAIAIYDKELPLKPGIQEKIGAIEAMPGCIRDSAPDAWGRRVILNKLLGIRGKAADPGDLSELTYLMESGSDRIGALDFQQSSTEYQARVSGTSNLEMLLESVVLVEKGIPLTPELAEALYHGTSIGGARPKALIESEGKKFVAKFSSSTDVYNIIKAEFVAMRLAQLCGLNVAAVKLITVAGKDILLVERFDREYKNNGWTRKLMLSALTLMNLDEMTARYASYQDFAEIIRHRFTNPKKALEELFSRIVFNILCGNTDDHARNHAAFWDGKHLSLTPAYDICPQLCMGGEASQAMIITGNNKTSKLVTCLQGAPHFMLSVKRAKEIIAKQVSIITTYWDEICEEAQLAPVDKALFKTRAWMSAYAFEDYDEISKSDINF